MGKKDEKSQTVLDGQHVTAVTVEAMVELLKRLRDLGERVRELENRLGKYGI